MTRSVAPLLLLAVSCLAGCAQPGASVPTLLDQDISIAGGLTGYADVSLDAHEVVHWSWTADHPVGFSARLRCPDRADEPKSAEPGMRGSGQFDAPVHGCVAEMLWPRGEQDNVLHLHLEGTGTVLQSGAETGTANTG